MKELVFSELFEALEKAGMEPMLCDTPVPFFDNKVACGVPTSVGDVVTDVLMVPQSTLSMQQEFFITAWGDSMEGADIRDGDLLKVKAQMTANDGDIVLAWLDGDFTVKSYCEDEAGRSWLVPQNAKYKAFPMSDADNARIFGVVMDVTRKACRVSYRDCMRLIHEAQMELGDKKEISMAQVSCAIQGIAPMVELARQWYAVCRVLEDDAVVTEGDFDAFCQLVRAEVPEHPHLPARDEMVRMASQSFKRPVAMWNEMNAPVQGKRYRDYLKIAQKMQDLLGEC